jgi:hypothetical protein
VRCDPTSFENAVPYSVAVLADRFGIFNLLIPFATVSSSLIFAVLGVSGPVGLVVVAILFGFASGSC